LEASVSAPRHMLIFPGAVPAPLCDKIVREGDKLVLEKAKVVSPTGGREDQSRKRDTHIARFMHEPQHQWLYDEAWSIVQQLNAKNWNFEINALEPPQYTVYGPHQFFGWHRDNAPYSVRKHQAQTELTRKISISIQLSSDHEYQGGDFEVIQDETKGLPEDDFAPASHAFGPEVSKQMRQKGTLLAFPAIFMHRVTPVLSGVRKALVVWGGGPPADFDDY